MNAALMAACAVNSSRTLRQTQSAPGYFGEDVHYKVTVRKYFHFDSQVLVTPINDIFARPFSMTRPVQLKPIMLPARTLATSYCFSVKASDCEGSIDSYIEAHLPDIEERAGWKDTEAKIVADYAEEIKNKYSVIAMPGALTYKSEVCWEVR
jgi:hypothetical protein